ncbi:MAG: hypothetical protein ACJ714_10495 [Ornithinibacter sp.]
MSDSGSATPWVAPVHWGVVGALVAFGVAGLATIGLFLLALAVVLVAVAFAVPALRRPSVPGVLVGLSTAPLFIAWLNRGGPGTVCTTAADSTSCADQWSPWPFVAVGLLLAGAGVVLLVSARWRGSVPPPTGFPDAAGSAPRT